MCCYAREKPRATHSCHNVWSLWGPKGHIWVIITVRGPSVHPVKCIWQKSKQKCPNVFLLVTLGSPNNLNSSNQTLSPTKWPLSQSCDHTPSEGISFPLLASKSLFLWSLPAPSGPRWGWEYNSTSEPVSLPPAEPRDAWTSPLEAVTHP